MIVDAVVRDPARKLEEITRALANDLDATNNFAPDGSIGQVLTSNGPMRPPSWQNIPTQTQQAPAATGAVSSVTGTASRVTASPATGAVIVDISASYVGQTSITTLGTVTVGTWQGTAVGATRGGTSQTTYAQGDILYASAVNTLSKLALAATDGWVLTVNSGTGLPEWRVAAAGGGVTSASGTASRITVSPTTGAVVVDISAAYVGQTSITTLGTIGAGTWQGASVATTYTDAKIVSVTGTLNRIAVSGAAFQDNAFQVDSFQNTTITAGAAIVNISASYVGQASITTLGTITTGVWQGSSVSTTYTDAKVISVSGTSGRVSVNNASFQDTMVQSNSFQDTSTSTVGVVLLDISDTYIGQPTITTVGALSSGSIVAGFGGAVFAGNVKITSGGFFVNNTVTGTATLSGGFVVVSSGRVTSVSNVFLCDQGGGASIGALYEDKAARVPGISFTVRSINVFDSSSFAWFIVEPS